MLSPLRWVISVLTIAVSLPSLSQKAAFSVRDDIAMARFNNMAPLEGDSGFVRLSPDGQYVVTVTTRGLLDLDLVESDLNVFSRKEIDARLHSGAETHSLQPRVVARIQSYPHHAEPSAYAGVITDVRWSLDRVHVFFRGENAQGNYQLYEVGLNGAPMRALTPPDRSIDQFAMMQDKIAYTFSKPGAESSEPPPRNPDGFSITGRHIQDILFPDAMKDIRAEKFHLGVLERRHGHWRDRMAQGFSMRDIRYLAFLYPAALSPLGDKLLIATPIPEIPKAWTVYEPAPGNGFFRFGNHDALRLAADNIQRPMQYSVIDLATGDTLYRVNAPNARTLGYGDGSRPSWSKDQTHVLVTNSFMPLPEHPPSTDSPQFPCGVVAIDLSARREQCVMATDAGATHRVRVLDAQFEGDGTVVSVLLDDGNGGKQFQTQRFEKGAWHTVSNTRMDDGARTIARPDLLGSEMDRSVRFFIHEDLNTPPALWFEETKTHEARELWNPNPQLSRLQFGFAEDYRWKDRTGYEWTGILVKPVGFTAGRQYPFVIQMYSVRRNQFLTDGTDPTAFAARHLASVGFVVLQIQKKPNALNDSDPQDALEGYRSAVTSLAGAGLIDRNKGGVAGFSWTAWYVETTLVRDPSIFAAATIADGLDNSYMSYFLSAEGNASVRHQLEQIYNGAPVAQGLKAWLERAPSFHLDQVRAPVRIEAINPFALLGEWELYSSLRIQGKPVDLIYFPKGTHIHQKPMERLESQQGNVDWFRFWLQGFEDPDPSKRDQYRRWQTLKQNQPL